MAKRARRGPLHEVHLPNLTAKTLVVGTLSLKDTAKKLRKPLPPPGKVHRSKKAYRRTPKHPGTGWEE